MSSESDVRAELEPDLDPAEVSPLAAVWERLEAERPVPRAAFRGEIGRYLMAEAEPVPGPRPRRFRMLLACYSGSGFVLLVAAAVGVLGSGPFAA